MDNFEQILKKAKEGNDDAEKQLKETFIRNSKEGSFEIAKSLVKKYYIKTLGEEKREIFIYKDGVFILGLNIVRNKISEILGELATPYYVNEIIERIKNLTPTDKKIFGNPDTDLICVKNGVVNLKSGELTEHKPEYQFTTQIPIIYDPKAQCLNFRKFLTETLEETDISTIVEWFGFCLLRAYPIKKSLILVGEKDTGKTTLLNVLKNFIGSENTCGVALQNLSDRFATLPLFRKHLNLVDDLSYQVVKEMGMFKMLCGNSSIPSEKKFGEHFIFENYAKLTYSCNKIPQPLSRDVDDAAYFSRWVVIKFDRQIDPKRQDKELVGKLTTPEELSGILNLALIGINRLFAKGDFTYQANPEEIREEMLKSDPLGAFAYDCLEENPDEWVSKEEMHNAFTQYAQKKKMPVMSIEKIGKSLSKYAPYIVAGMKPNAQTGRQQRVWKNVKIVSDNA
jgi:putative DNA primase/helicase